MKLTDFSEKIYKIIDKHEKYDEIIKSDFEKIKKGKYINTPRYFYYLLLFLDENILQKMEWISNYDISENINVIKELLKKINKEKIINYLKSEYINIEVLESYTILLFFGLICNFKYNELFNNINHIDKIIRSFKYFIINIIRNEKNII